MAHLAEGSWLPSLVWLRTVEELVALEGVAAAHVTGAAAIMVGAGVANCWSCLSCRYDERVATPAAVGKDESPWKRWLLPLLLLLRLRWQRRRKMKQVCRIEREREGVAVAACGCASFLWWSWYLWWCIVWVCWYSRRRRQLWKRWREPQKADGERRKMETGERLVFCDFWTRFSPPQVINAVSIYRREEGNIIYIGVKFQPLIQLVRIPTVGSK